MIFLPVKNKPVFPIESLLLEQSKPFLKALENKEPERAVSLLPSLRLESWAPPEQLWMLSQILHASIPYFASTHLQKTEFLWVAVKFLENCPSFDGKLWHQTQNWSTEQWARLPFGSQTMAEWNILGSNLASHVEDYHSVSIHNQEATKRFLRFYAKLDLPWWLLGELKYKAQPPVYEVLLHVVPDLKASIAQTHKVFAAFVEKIDVIEGFSFDEKTSQNVLSLDKN